ncbi:MAG: hypothetical protein ACLQPD_33700, partial [Desulfomonilaceae bacterium]
DYGSAEFVGPVFQRDRIVCTGQGLKITFVCGLGDLGASLDICYTFPKFQPFGFGGLPENTPWGVCRVLHRLRQSYAQEC